ncbi:MAG TPA: TolC family protein [Terracidiphilus sp.]|nr:TolC family protein [Terracidiphilus sp.]
MNPRFYLLLAAVLLLRATSAASAQTQGSPSGLTQFEALLAAEPKAAASGPAMTLDEAERVAMAANPEIAVAARRVAVAEAHLPAAGALDDPVAMYRGWGVPLSKPWDFNQAQNMFSLSQSLPGTGKRALRSSIAQSDVDVAKAQLAEVRIEVQVRVRKAFDDLLLADQEMQIHKEHVGIAKQAIEAARIKYTVGKVSQQDILKAQVELTALGEHMIRFDRDAGVARARLNTLMGRNANAPLDLRGQFAVLAELPSAQTLEAAALQSRPDLVAARDAAERSHKEKALAKRTYVPDFTVSGGYMLMAPSSSFRNNYMVEGSMTLPWLNRRKNNGEIAEATARATEQDAELADLRVAAFGQIQDALVEAQAAQKFALLYHDQLLPQAEATLQSSVIAYENDKTDFLNLLDSQMTVIDIDLAWVQSLRDFDTRLADLELATGVPLEQLQQSAPEVKP